MRVFAPREGPHPGAQLSLFEAVGGWRYFPHVTNLPAATRDWRGQCAYIDAAHRADIECFARDLEARGRARTTITRSLSTIAGLYRCALEEELLEHSAAAHVRRPRLDYESHAVGLDGNANRSATHPAYMFTRRPSSATLAGQWPASVADYDLWGWTAAPGPAAAEENPGDLRRDPSCEAVFCLSTVLSLTGSGHHQRVLNLATQQPRRNPDRLGRALNPPRCTTCRDDHRGKRIGAGQWEYHRNRGAAGAAL
jgi:hypothetical protein